MSYRSLYALVYLLASLTTGCVLPDPVYVEVDTTLEAEGVLTRSVYLFSGKWEERTEDGRMVYLPPEVVEHTDEDGEVYSVHPDRNRTKLHKHFQLPQPPDGATDVIVAEYELRYRHQLAASDAFQPDVTKVLPAARGDILAARSNQLQVQSWDLGVLQLHRYQEVVGDAFDYLQAMEALEQLYRLLEDLYIANWEVRHGPRYDFTGLRQWGRQELLPAAREALAITYAMLQAHRLDQLEDQEEVLRPFLAALAQVAERRGLQLELPGELSGSQTEELNEWRLEAFLLGLFHRHVRPLDPDAFMPAQLDDFDMDPLEDTTLERLGYLSKEDFQAAMAPHLTALVGLYGQAALLPFLQDPTVHYRFTATLPGRVVLRSGGEQLDGATVRFSFKGHDLMWREEQLTAWSADVVEAWGRVSDEPPPTTEELTELARVFSVLLPHEQEQLAAAGQACVEGATDRPLRDLEDAADRKALREAADTLEDLLD